MKNAERLDSVVWPNELYYRYKLQFFWFEAAEVAGRLMLIGMDGGCVDGFVLGFLRYGL